MTVGSPTVLRLQTDAPTIELAGYVPVNLPCSQTLIVDGRLVPPKALSVSNGSGGGYNVVAASIAFGSRAMRDIWLETGMWLSYVKLGANDTLQPVNDSADPQMTVVGDDYLRVGSNTFGNDAALALEIAARLGISKIAVDGVDGSGYWNSGYSRGNFNDRVAAHAADNSTVYLVIGGFNDYADLVAPPPHDVWPTRAQYESAVNSYFQALRAAQPNALIVATAPMCPNPTLSDASYVSNAGTNTSGAGDFTYKSSVQRAALSAIAGPWIWIDSMMGTGWQNSSGASGGVTGLQWLTGGVAIAGTSASYKPGNPGGGSGGGFGGIASVPIAAPGRYSQAPDIIVDGGSGAGLLLASTIDSTGALNDIVVMAPGEGYGSALPSVTIDPSFQRTAGALGTPVLMQGVNPQGVYPLAGFAPATVPAGYSNTFVNLLPDLARPSPSGVDYLASRLAQSLFEAIMAL